MAVATRERMEGPSRAAAERQATTNTQVTTKDHTIKILFDAAGVFCLIDMWSCHGRVVVKQHFIVFLGWECACSVGMRVFCNMMQRALSFVYSIDQLNIDKSFIIINQLGHYRSVVLTAGKHTTARVVLGRVGGFSSPHVPVGLLRIYESTADQSLPSPHVPVGLLRIYESTADQSFPSPQASGHGPLGLEPGLRRPRRHTLGRRQQVVHAAPLPHARPAGSATDGPS